MGDVSSRLNWISADVPARAAVFLASGRVDGLSGRFLRSTDDFGQILRSANEIIMNDLLQLRLRGLDNAEMDKNEAIERGEFGGKVAVVTGGSRNIGYAIAYELARNGASVVISARGATALTEAATTISERTGSRVLAVPGDASSTESIDELVDATLAEFGRADVIVNNAIFGVDSPADVLHATDDAWHQVFDGYVLRPLQLARRLTPTMADGTGSIINVLSTAAFSPLHGQGAYGVGKAAMWALTRQLAYELAPEIRVNAVCPGTVSATGELDRPGWERLLRPVPMGRVGLAKEVAHATLFLASNCAAYTTGQVIYVDGGRTSLLSPVARRPAGDAPTP